MKEFTLATREATDNISEMFPSARPLSVKFPDLDRVIEAHPPENAAPILFLVSMGAEDVSTAEKTFTMTRVLSSIMSDDDAKFIRNSLATGKITYSMVTDMYSYLIEEWGKRPTRSPRGSSSRQRSTGQSSTDSAPSEE